MHKQTQFTRCTYRNRLFVPRSKRHSNFKLILSFIFIFGSINEFMMSSSLAIVEFVEFRHGPVNETHVGLKTGLTR